MSTRKELFGSSKRKRDRNEEKMTQSLKGHMDKFLLKASDESIEFEQPTETTEENYVENVLGDLSDNKNDETENDHGVTISELELVEQRYDIDIFDPRVWDSLDDSLRTLLVKIGPKRETNLNYPLDELSEHFSDNFYVQVISNGEICDRKWLVYSKELDKVFCFCCKLFKKTNSKSQLANEGYKDWKHINEKLVRHENNIEHLTNMRTWMEIKTRLRKNQTYVKDLQERVAKDTPHWRDVILRIIAVVKYLATHNLTVCETNEKHSEEANDNFLGMLDMIVDFDPIMQYHFQLIQDKNTHYHYLSNEIQNDLIAILASKVKKAIIEKIKKSKYFSVILGCTLDTNYKEQMALIVRCVDVSSNPVEVEEYFLEFFHAEDTSELEFVNKLQDVLKSLDLDINNVRGQGYDIGSNLKGKHQGVPKRLFDINPRAFYMPCSSESIVLTLCDMVNSFPKTKSFFGACQCIYAVFANSTKWWNVLLEYVDGLTLKSLSTTHWEINIRSVEIIKSQFSQIRDALFKLAEISEDAKLSWDADSLASKELSSFEFVLSLVIWYDVLDKIDLVSKNLESKDMCCGAIVKQLDELVLFFKKYKENGFASVMLRAQELAANIRIEFVFRKKCHFHVAKEFDENPKTTREQQSNENSFRTEYFDIIVDMTISLLNIWFEQLQSFQSIFGFMCNAAKLVSFDDKELKNSCVNLEDVLKVGDKSDINARCLCSELQVLQLMLPLEAYETDKPWTSVKILQFAKEMDMFPNVILAYKILLTLPENEKSVEKSFSKLKLSKSYLQTTMSQDKLNELAILCIENDMLKKIDYTDIFDDLALKKCKN